jgi:myosin heavy subunit
MGSLQEDLKKRTEEANQSGGLKKQNEEFQKQLAEAKGLEEKLKSIAKAQEEKATKATQEAQRERDLKMLREAKMSQLEKELDMERAKVKEGNTVALKKAEDDLAICRQNADRAMSVAIDYKRGCEALIVKNNSVEKRCKEIEAVAAPELAFQTTLFLLDLPPQTPSSELHRVRRRLWEIPFKCLHHGPWSRQTFQKLLFQQLFKIQLEHRELGCRQAQRLRQELPALLQVRKESWNRGVLALLERQWPARLKVLRSQCGSCLLLRTWAWIPRPLPQRLQPRSRQLPPRKLVHPQLV